MADYASLIRPTHFPSTRPHDTAARTLGTAGLWPAELGMAQTNLEDVFLELTRAEHLTTTQHGGGPRHLLTQEAAR